jgi:hypothetical protein
LERRLGELDQAGVEPFVSANRSRQVPRVNGDVGSNFREVGVSTAITG